MRRSWMLFWSDGAGDARNGGYSPAYSDERKAMGYHSLGAAYLDAYQRSLRKSGGEAAGRRYADQAIVSFQTAIRIDPAYAAPHYNLGIILKMRGSRGEALEQYLSAVRLSPDSVEVRFNLGLLYRETGDGVNARRQFEAILRLAPENEKARKFLAALLE